MQRRADGAVDTSQVLLIRRGKAPARGQWSLPGGSVELGEGVAQAAVREVKEETSLDVQVSDRPAFTSTDAIYSEEPGSHDAGAASRHGGAGDGAADTPAPIIYHFVLVHVAGTVPAAVAHSIKAQDDATEAAWVPVSKLATMGSALVKQTEAVVQRAIASFDAGMV